MFNFADNYISFRWIFASGCGIGILILYLFRSWIYHSYRHHPVRRRFFKVAQPLIPAFFSLFCSYWLSHTKESFLPAAVFIILPFFSLYGIYCFFLGVGEELLGADIGGFKAQIKSLSEIVALEEYMQKLIKSKAKRFLDFYKRLTSETGLLDKCRKGGSSVFDTITQPDEQIGLMVIALHEYFKRHIVHDPDKCNVTVMAPVGDQLKFVYHKEIPRSKGIKMFSFGRSAAGKAWQSGKMIIIPDKQQELEDEPGRRIYDPGARDAKEDSGSLICYPVFDPDLGGDHKSSLIYVINITSTRSNNFSVEDKTHYEKIFEGISERMLLESRLLKIKDVIGKSA